MSEEKVKGEKRRGDGGERERGEKGGKGERRGEERGVE